MSLPDPTRGALLSSCSLPSKCWQFGPLTDSKLVFPEGNESPNSHHMKIIKNASSLQSFYIMATVTRLYNREERKRSRRAKIDVENRRGPKPLTRVGSAEGFTSSDQPSKAKSRTGSFRSGDGYDRTGRSFPTTRTPQTAGKQRNELKNCFFYLPDSFRHVSQLLL